MRKAGNETSCFTVILLSCINLLARKIMKFNVEKCFSVFLIPRSKFCFDRFTTGTEVALAHQILKLSQKFWTWTQSIKKWIKVSSALQVSQFGEFFMPTLKSQWLQVIILCNIRNWKDCSLVHLPTAKGLENISSQKCNSLLKVLFHLRIHFGCIPFLSCSSLLSIW